MSVTILYFAWLRERIGEHSEQIDTQAATISELIDQLEGKGPAYQLAFSDRTVLRASLDGELVDHDAPIAGAKEIAFFPPMTGG